MDTFFRRKMWKNELKLFHISPGLYRVIHCHFPMPTLFCLNTNKTLHIYYSRKQIFNNRVPNTRLIRWIPHGLFNYILIRLKCEHLARLSNCSIQPYRRHTTHAANCNIYFVFCVRFVDVPYKGFLDWVPFKSKKFPAQIMENG